MRIIHTADWHWSEETLTACMKSAEFVIETTRRIKPDLHVIAGDFWNRRQHLCAASAVLPAIDAVQRLAFISPVVIILGNHTHDAPGSLEVFNHLDVPHPVYASEVVETIALVSSPDGKQRFERLGPDGTIQAPGDSVRAIIHLMPYLYKAGLLEAEQQTSVGESGLMLTNALRGLLLKCAAVGSMHNVPKILVAHCAVGEATLPAGQMAYGHDVLFSIRDLELCGADYAALGHIHLNQQLSESIAYAGSLYPLNYGETDGKYLNVVKINKGKVSIKPIKIPTRPLILHEARYDTRTGTIVDQNDATDWIGADLRVRISVEEEDAAVVFPEQVRSRYAGALSYKIEKIIVPKERLRAELISHARSLREKLIAWARVVEKELPPEVMTLADEVEQHVGSD